MMSIDNIVATVRNLKTCTFLKIQSIYELLMLTQKEENIIQYFIIALAQAIKKVHVLRFLSINGKTVLIDSLYGYV